MSDCENVFRRTATAAPNNVELYIHHIVKEFHIKKAGNTIQKILIRVTAGSFLLMSSNMSNGTNAKNNKIGNPLSGHDSASKRPLIIGKNGSILFGIIEFMALHAKILL